MLFGKRQERLPLQAKCRKGKPCGAICIPKGSSCREGKRTGDNEVTRYNQEYIASLFTQSVNPWTGQPDFQKFRSLPRVEQQKALKSAYRWLEDAKVEKKTRKDASAGADKPAPGGKCVREDAYFRAARRSGIKLDSLRNLMKRRIRTDRDRQNRFGLQTVGAMAGEVVAQGADKLSKALKPGSAVGKFAGRAATGIRDRYSKSMGPELAYQMMRQKGVSRAEANKVRKELASSWDSPDQGKGGGAGMKAKFVKTAGSCGPGWKPGPGGKCVRTKRAIVKRVAVGAGLLAAGAAGATGYHNRESISEGAAGVSSAVQGGVQGAKAGVKKALRDRAVRDRAQKVEQKAYDKGFSSRMSESFEPKVANFQGRKSAMEAREKFERRAGKRGDSELSRLDGPRSMVDGKCGEGWKPGPGGKCIRSSKSGLGYGQVGKGAKGKAKWAAKRLLMASGDVEYNRRRSLGQDRKTAALHGFGSGLKSIVETAGTLGGGAIYRRSRDAGQSRGRALAKGLATGVGVTAARAGLIAAQTAGLTAAQRASLSRKNNKDSLMDDYYSEIAQIIEYSQGIRVDSIYGLEDQGSSLVGIASSGGDFFEFEIDSRSTGVAPRPDLTHSANERARGALSAMGISYRGDSAYEFLCGMEFREDNLGQSAKAAIGRVKSAVMGGVNRVKQAFGSKPATPAPASGGKRRMLKRAAKIGAGLAVAGGGVAAYKNRDKIKAAAPGISSAAQGAARDVGRSINQGVNAAKRKVAAAQVARTKFADPKDVNPF